MKKVICIIAVIALSGDFAFAQTKKPEAFTATLDCADINNSVQTDNIKKCTKIVLNGSGSENYVIVSAIVSMKDGDVLKEFSIKGEELNNELLIETLGKIQKGEYVFIENARIKNTASSVVKTLPSTKITFK